MSERLGHSKVSMTMEVYYVLPDMQQEAAARLAIGVSRTGGETSDCPDS